MNLLLFKHFSNVLTASMNETSSFLLVGIVTAYIFINNFKNLRKIYAMRFPIQHLIACNWLRVPAFPRSNIPICTYLPLGVPLSLYAGRCL